MVLVTSAAGGAASWYIPELLKKGITVKAMDINPKVEEWKSKGVAETFVGDARKSEDLQQALAGCDQVLYVPPMFVYDEADMAKRCIDLAVEANVKQFVFVSVTHPNMSTLLQHTQKLLGEEYLIYKGLSDRLNYTILQPMHYNHNFMVPLVWEANAYNIFYTPSTKLSYVDACDVGEVAAKVLTEDGHQNATYELVGPDFLSPQDMVGIFNEITGRNASANLIPVEAMFEFFGNSKYDSYFRETFYRLSDTYGRYGIAGNPNVLTWLLGRKPTTFKDYVLRELKAHNLQ
ncbi:NmrA family NAD(P)-binding protein [Ruminococcaceae bacterium OttesenSCG-928-D13]|nr:NmrA family NAD(P)-binding protein [Ruminococcaceae bacterium OttesenSCG-928-D13]